MALFFIIRLVASISLKAGKNMIRKGRCPKFSFVWKHFKRAAGFFTLYPLVLLLMLQVIQLFSPGSVSLFKYGLVASWVAVTVYKEYVVGKTKKIKTGDKIEKTPPASSLISYLETLIKRTASTASILAYRGLTLAEKVSALVHLSDFFVIFVAISVFDNLCLANFSIEIEQALRQAFVMTSF